MLSVYPPVIRADASAFAVFVGPPNRSLAWSLIGQGTLTQVDLTTNSLGTAKAVFTPTQDNQVVEIVVSYVP